MDRKKKINQGCRSLSLLNTEPEREFSDLLRFYGLVHVSSSKSAVVEKRVNYSTMERHTKRAQKGRLGGVEAYVLKDDGASENFVARRFIDRLRKAGAELDVPEEGTMRVRTAKMEAKEPEKEVRQRVRLKINLGDYY